MRSEPSWGKLPLSPHAKGLIPRLKEVKPRNTKYM